MSAPAQAFTVDPELAAPPAAPEPPADRAAINRQNAQLSTGPRTDAGKLRSSLNALRHGLTSRDALLPSEDPAAYEAHRQLFFADLQPLGALEEQLVHSLASTAWRLNRIPALEADLLADGFAQQARALATLSMNEQRLSRQFDRTLKQLREIQAERRAAEADQAAARLNVAEVRTADGKTGFVLSENPIDSWLQRHEAQERALAFRPERRQAPRTAAAAAAESRGCTI